MANGVIMPGAAPNDYALDYQAAERQRKLAEALQAQSAEALPVNQMAGGWVVPTSPLQGLAKVAQALSGAYINNSADRRERDLAKRYQLDTADTLSRAMSAKDIPAIAANPGGAPVDYQGAEMAGPPSPSRPGQDAQSAESQQASILAGSQNPALQASGIKMMMDNAELQRQQRVFGLQDQSQGAPVPGGDATAPQGAAATLSGALQAPQAGSQSSFDLIPRRLQSQLLEGDHSGKTLAGKLADAFMASQKPTRFTPGGGLALPNGQVIVSAPQTNGIVTNYGPNGPTQSNVPGSLDANAAVAQTQAGSKAAGEAPFSMQLMDVPVYLPGGDQINVKMNAVQAHQYQTTGQLPPEVAASISGLNGPKATVSPNVSMADVQAIADPKERAAALSALQNNRYSQGPVIGRTQSQGEQITQQRQAAGGKATDEGFAKDYTAFVQGGASDAAKQLSQLGDVITALKTPGANLTGPVLGRTPDLVKSFTNPQAIAMRERVEEVAQRSLRAILGAQFTEKEGERLISRAYNPNLSESENSIRVGRLFTQLQQAFQSKKSAAQYFEKNGTLQGWQGKLPSISDFDAGSAGATADFSSPSASATPVGWSIKALP